MRINKTPAPTVVSQRQYHRRNFFRTLKEFCGDVEFKNGDILHKKIELRAAKTKHTKIVNLQMEIAEKQQELLAQQAKLKETCPHPLEYLMHCEKYTEDEFGSHSANMDTEWIECELCGTQTHATTRV